MRSGAWLSASAREAPPQERTRMKNNPATITGTAGTAERRLTSGNSVAKEVGCQGAAAKRLDPMRVASAEIPIVADLRARRFALTVEDGKGRDRFPGWTFLAVPKRARLAAAHLDSAVLTIVAGATARIFIETGSPDAGDGLSDEPGIADFRCRSVQKRAQRCGRREQFAAPASPALRQRAGPGRR